MRLIDADNLIEECYKDGAYGYVDALQIAIAPTIDAVPVNHGRWIMLPYTELYKNKCSNCEKGSDLETDYCPNCGAKMDGE